MDYVKSIWIRVKFLKVLLFSGNLPLSVVGKIDYVSRNVINLPFTLTDQFPGRIYKMKCMP